MDTKEKPKVIFETEQGNIEITLWPEVAPKTVENFVSLVNKGYYNGIIFHRVIEEFMIQGGDPTGTGMGGESMWGKSFEDEFKPNISFNRPYLLAMANRGPNTNGSQFFITTIETPWLNNKHTIFGEVSSGVETVQKIEKCKVGPQDKPKTPQTIKRAYVK